MDATGNINDLPVVNLAQIFEKLPWQERLKIEQVCKNWQHVAKNFSWSNYRMFDNYKYHNWPEARAMQIKPFFERCGRHLRQLSLRHWSPDVSLSFIRMAPNVQHLRLWIVKLDAESWKELAGIGPGLKSLAFYDLLRREATVSDYSLGLMECFKVMTGLEYLSIFEQDALLGSHSFVQFPSNLKYLGLYYVSNIAQILSWVAKGCQNLKGLSLRCSTEENLLHAISQIKSLTYLAMVTSRDLKYPYEIGYVFEELTELRALKIDTLDETLISAIAQYCKKLEHLHIYDLNDDSHDVSHEQHAAILRLTSLPNLCSLSILTGNYSKEQRTELVNRLIAKGNLEYIKVERKLTARMPRNVPLESEILIEILCRCKSIRSIALVLGPINSDFHSKICQVVDEIDEEYRKQGEFAGMTHPIVEVQCIDEQYLAGSIMTYKWLKFMEKISPSAVCEKWEFGWLSAGKPKWES